MSDSTAVIATGRRLLAPALVLGALTFLALLMGSGSAHADERGLGQTLGTVTARVPHITAPPVERDATPHAPPAARPVVADASTTVHHVLRQAPQVAAPRVVPPLTAAAAPSSGAHTFRSVAAAASSSARPSTRPVRTVVAPVHRAAMPAVPTGTTSTLLGTARRAVEHLSEPTSLPVGGRIASPVVDSVAGLVTGSLTGPITGVLTVPVDVLRPSTSHVPSVSAPVSTSATALGARPVERVDVRREGVAQALASASRPTQPATLLAAEVRHPSVSRSAARSAGDRMPMPRKPVSDSGLATASASSFTPAGLLVPTALVLVAAGLLRFPWRRTALRSGPVYPPGSAPD